MLGELILVNNTAQVNDLLDLCFIQTIPEIFGRAFFQLLKI